MRNVAILAVLALLAAPVAAQTCNLAVSGTLTPGDTISISLTDSIPNSIAILAVGTTAGSTSFSFGMLGGFTLDLDTPFALLPLGLTDANGDAGISITIPASATLPSNLPSTTLILQSVTVGFSFGMGMPPGLSFCVSNTANFSI